MTLKIVKNLLMNKNYIFKIQGAGISSDNAQYATLGVGAIMVTMSIVTIPFMDKLGRRTLHFVSINQMKLT